MPLPAANDPATTPAMRQYQRFKQQYPDCVLFFRMGDFYEMFHDDAVLAHRVLGVTLTQRTEGVPMAGVPFHAVEGYLQRMIRAGYRVAVCDQIEDPAQAKGIVQRDVRRVVTPGTLTDEALLEEGRENPLLALMFLEKDQVALAWAELSTGAFHLAVLEAGALAEEIARLGPRELLYVETGDRRVPQRVQELLNVTRGAATARPAWQFRQTEAVEILRKQFQVATLAGFGLSEDDPALGPAGAVLHYLRETQCVGVAAADAPGAALGHLQPPRRFERAEYLVIDPTSLRSLEVERTIRTGGTDGSLLGVFQDCATAMGKRTLRHWLCYPLARRAAIEARQRVVGALVEDERLRDALRTALEPVQDVERIAGRLGVGRAGPRDVVALGRSCAQAGQLAQLLAERPAVAPYHQALSGAAATLAELAREIARQCVESPPAHLRDGGLFRDGCDALLDECRALQRDSNTWLAGYQKQLIEATGIPTLKVGYNKVFGFYIELTATQRDKAPAGWARKQTLKNAERFITPELKDYEHKVLTAEQRAIAREQELFLRLAAQVQGQLPALRQFAGAAAELDVLTCFARRAVRRKYVQPVIVDEPALVIRGGRHPVLDEILGEKFVPNDLVLGAADAMDDGVTTPVPSPQPSPEGRGSYAPGGKTLALITGPNMAGKSTFIRQAALLTLLAHTGSFVPADEAVIGLTDRIFTRVGASDELHAGASTFMVEMTETASICHHATRHSLVILDEIGRGTSTLDGLSLAWAIAEHLALQQCRTLFATHYHEITSLAEELANVTNLHVTVREWADQIVFLHRVNVGATDKSYGIHVAKIAGLPGTVVQRARELLSQLEVNHHPQGAGVGGSVRGGDAAAGKEENQDARPSGRGCRGRDAAGQMSLFTEYVEHPALKELRGVEIDTLSPLQAFDLLRRLAQQARGEK